MLLQLRVLAIELRLLGMVKGVHHGRAGGIDLVVVVGGEHFGSKVYI